MDLNYHAYNLSKETASVAFLAGREIAILTPDDYSFSHGFLLVNDVTDIVVRVKACNDAHIALATLPESDGEVLTYEVVIGGYKNSKSVIRQKRLGPNSAVADTQAVLSCTEFRSFWVSWKSALIEVGFGEVRGVDTFLSWQDPKPHAVESLSFSSGFGASADFRLEWMQGLYNVNYVYRVTPPIAPYVNIHIYDNHFNIHRNTFLLSNKKQKSAFQKQIYVSKFYIYNEIRLIHLTDISMSNYILKLRNLTMWISLCLRQKLRVSYTRYFRLAKP